MFRFDVQQTVCCNEMQIQCAVNIPYIFYWIQQTVLFGCAMETICCNENQMQCAVKYDVVLHADAAVLHADAAVLHADVARLLHFTCLFFLSALKIAYTHTARV
jgi:hypothetical protein